MARIPAGYRNLIATCGLKGADKAIELYKLLFGAHEKTRFSLPDGTVAHAELQIGGDLFMLGEAKEPRTMGILLWVDDVDETFRRAVETGCTVIFPLADQFYGDRSGRVRDPFGNEWLLATHIEDVSDEEQQRRFQKIARGESWR